MAISPATPNLATVPTQADALLGFASIILAFLLPPVSIFIAKGALDRAKEQGVENRLAYWGFWISLAMTLFAVVAVLGSIVLSLPGMPLTTA